MKSFYIAAFIMILCTVSIIPLTFYVCSTLEDILVGISELPDVTDNVGSRLDIIEEKWDKLELILDITTTHRDIVGAAGEFTNLAHAIASRNEELYRCTKERLYNAVEDILHCKVPSFVSIM